MYCTLYVTIYFMFAIFKAAKLSTHIMCAIDQSVDTVLTTCVSHTLISLFIHPLAIMNLSFIGGGGASCQSTTGQQT